MTRSVMTQREREGRDKITRKEEFKELRNPGTGRITPLGNAVKNTTQQIF